MTARKTKGTTLRLLQAYFPAKSIRGTKLRCPVFSIKGPKSTSRPGITKKTESRAKRMAFMRQMPMSGPILNCMKSMAARPPMVVRALALISVMARLRAAMAASRMGRVWCCSLKWLQRMTA